VCEVCGRRNKEMSLGCWWGKIEGKISLEDLDVDGRLCTAVIWPRRGLIKAAMQIQAP
jgi:hypothetical protein